MRLQCSWANTGNLGKDVESDRLGQMVAKPTDSAHQVSRQRPGELCGACEVANRIVASDRTKSRHRKCTEVPNLAYRIVRFWRNLKVRAEIE